MVQPDAEPQARTRELAREIIPLLAVVIVVLAAAGEPAAWWYVVAIALTVPVFAAWSRGLLPAPVVTGAVLVAVAFSQLSGMLEPALFLLSLLGLVITGWAPLTVVSAASVAIVTATPPLLAAVQAHGDAQGDLAWGTWMIGIAFPAFMGFAFHRQEALTQSLEAARRELAEQTILEERRRIARDVHDLVGHGLAAIMLQVTSARHVLRRDPDAAEEALAAAEDSGRQSMQELRHTVALLREGDSATAPPPPGVSQVAALVGSARDAGLDVEHRTTGDHGRLDAVQGLALYRIVQESLANASRHAPQARTVVVTQVDDDTALLTVDTDGPLRSHEEDGARPRYGLRGMRERMEAVGGDFEAGPTSTGWSVRCTLPLAPTPAPATPAAPAAPVGPVGPVRS